MFHLENCFRKLGFQFQNLNLHVQVVHQIPLLQLEYLYKKYEMMYRFDNQLQIVAFYCVRLSNATNQLLNYMLVVPGQQVYHHARNLLFAIHLL